MNCDEIARCDDVASLRSLLRDSDDVNVNERHGDLCNTPLHRAAWKGNIEVTNLLLQHGADSKAQNKKGLTPAHVAAHYGRTEVLKSLIAHDGSLLKCKDLVGNTVLHIASCKGHKNVLDYLLKENASASTRNKDGNTPHHLAVLWKRLHVLRVLLRYDKSGMEYENKAGFSLLHLSASKGYDEITHFLLANGASMVKRDRNGRTPLQVATIKSQKVFHKFKEYKKIIASCATDMGSLLPSKRYEDSDTALHIMASFDNSSEHIQTLIKTGSSINILNGCGKTPLLVAVSGGNTANVSTLLLYCSKNALPCSEDGNSPLHVAAQNNDLDCISVLLKHGCCHVNSKDTNGETPLTYLIKHQSWDGVLLLHQYGCDFTMPCRHDNNALHLATIANNFHIANFIVKACPELVNCRNCNGDTPLSLAVEGNSFAITKLLLEFGADADEKNDNGSSPYSMAMESRNERLVGLFDVTRRNPR